MPAGLALPDNAAVTVLNVAAPAAVPPADGAVPVAPAVCAGSATMVTADALAPGAAGGQDLVTDVTAAAWLLAPVSLAGPGRVTAADDEHDHQREQYRGRQDKAIQGRARQSEAWHGRPWHGGTRHQDSPSPPERLPPPRQRLGRPCLPPRCEWRSDRTGCEGGRPRTRSELWRGLPGQGRGARR